jgi:hypothetical protein
LKRNTLVVFEITLSNLRSDGEIDERFYGSGIIVFSRTNGNDFKFPKYKVVEYFSNYARMGLAMGVNNLVDIFDEKYTAI